MAKVKYEGPVKSVSGKLSKDSKVIYKVRRAATSNKAMQENPCYSCSQGVRSTPYSDAEKAAQVRFGKIGAETTKRLNDAGLKDADMAAFKAQTQYTTLRQYVWHAVAATVA